MYAYKMVALHVVLTLHLGSVSKKRNTVSYILGASSHQKGYTADDVYTYSGKYVFSDTKKETKHQFGVTFALKPETCWCTPEGV